jgi:GntR family transcriptional regulator, transcriptional repressor for pyruvate dehydrogenase complex
MLTNTIALKLIEYILDNELSVGAKLPSIRELAGLWDCNQSQVRTGLITLSALGLIDMHPRAGSFVKQLAPDDLDNLFVLFFRLGMLGKDTDIANVYAVKSLLDKEIFLNAIKYRTEDDLFHLEENLALQVKVIDDCRAFMEADEAFHYRLAQIIRNPLIVYLLEAVQVMLRPYRNHNLTPGICRESYESHVKIYEAIRDQNSSDAEMFATLHTLPRMRRLQAMKEAQGDAASLGSPAARKDVEARA